MSDLCASPFCSDLALPGRDLCSGCLQDAVWERARVDAEAARLTEQHEGLVEAQEQAA